MFSEACVPSPKPADPSSAPCPGPGPDPGPELCCLVLELPAERLTSPPPKRLAVNRELPRRASVRPNPKTRQCGAPRALPLQTARVDPESELVFRVLQDTDKKPGKSRAAVPVPIVLRERRQLHIDVARIPAKFFRRKRREVLDVCVGQSIGVQMHSSPAHRAEVSGFRSDTRTYRRGIRQRPVTDFQVRDEIPFSPLDDRLVHDIS